MAGFQAAAHSHPQATLACNRSSLVRPTRIAAHCQLKHQHALHGPKLSIRTSPQCSRTSALVANASLDESNGREDASGAASKRLGMPIIPEDGTKLADNASPIKNRLQKFWDFLQNFGIGTRGLDGTVADRIPEAKGDMNYLIGQPFFVPLYKLYVEHGHIFRLNFGPKSFLIISDPTIAKHLLKDNSKAYSKGILAEILEFVMGTGLIPAEQEVWRVRRRAIVPALHLKYVAEMVGLFGRTTEHLCKKLDVAARDGDDVEMESLFSRLTLDVIGKAVFNYDFDSLSHDKGIVEAVYVALREAEYRSISVIPYWNIPIIKDLSPRQRKVRAALKLINETLDEMIAKCKRMIEEESLSFSEEYLNEKDPSILQFLLASRDEVSNKQLRDDLMTLLIAGHETSAAVLTWAFYLLAKNPAVTVKLQQEVDLVLGDRVPTMEDMKKLKLTRRVINETLRLYPQPPVLIRRSLQDDVLGRYHIKKGEDIFISVWNLHRSPHLWEDPDEFTPERWPLDGADPTEVTENFRYLPFGGGPRKCVGDMFATFETITAVAMLVRRFNFELARGAPPVDMTTGATIHTTDGLKMTVTPRAKSQVMPKTTMSTLALLERDQSRTTSQ